MRPVASVTLRKKITPNKGDLFLYLRYRTGSRTADLRARIGRKRARMANASKSRGPQGRGRMPMTEGETRRFRITQKKSSPRTDARKELKS